MSSVIAFLGDNAAQTDAAERESDLRKKLPNLLQNDEYVLFAFKDRGGKGRDSSSFTSKRLLIKNKTGFTGKKTEYLSVPYSAIRGYAVETSGSMDSDQELKLFVAGVGRIKMDFVNDVDLFALHGFLNEMVLVGNRAGFHASENIPTTDVSGGDRTSIFDLLGDNASQIDAKTVESELKSSSPGILVPDETIELAFKCGRDSFLLTSKRILQVDVQGFSGSKVEYFTVLWSSVRAFSVETAGNFFDRDSELTLFTNIPDSACSSPGRPHKDRTRMRIDFRKGQADIFAVKRFFADKILGPDTVPVSEHAVNMAGVADTGSDNVFSWLGDDSRMIDVGPLNAKYHSDPPILQGCELVEMAFKGRRDLMLFTCKRLIFVDLQGWSGKKVEYMSIPWTTVKIYGVQSAGSFMDKDSEMMIWTDFDDCFFPPKEDEDSPPPPPIPRYSYLKLDFQKDKVDLMAVHRYLSERCLHVEGSDAPLPYTTPVSEELMAPSPPDALSTFLGWLGDDAHEINPSELNEQMHGYNAMLQEDETVVLAYKAGRDTFIITNKRVFLIDVKGVSGKRIKYISIPFTSIRAFAIESAGSWDTDAEVKLWTKTYWSAEGGLGNKLDQDLRKNKADIIALQSYLASQIIGRQDGSPAVIPEATAAQAGKIDTFLSFLNDHGVAQDAPLIDQRLHSSPPILQPDESVDACYKIGRDLCVFTTKRILLVDVQGFSGKRVEYRSVPLRYVYAFKVRTAGQFVSAAEATIFCDGSKTIEQDLAKSSSDIWAVQSILMNKVLN